MKCGYVCFNDRAYLSQTLMDFPQIWLILKPTGPRGSTGRGRETQHANFSQGPTYYRPCGGPIVQPIAEENP